jgi:hypothetical protein
MITIVILFAVAALAGLSVLVPVLQGKTPKRAFALVHGGIAALALVLLLLQYFRDMASVPQLSVIIFVVAALGGFVLFAHDLQKNPIPKALALVHAGAAVVAFLILLLSVL